MRPRVGRPATRIIKKIFVTRIDFDKTSKTYSAVTPQGTMRMVMHRAFMGPGDYQEPNGFPVADRGRLRPEIWEAWHAAVGIMSEENP
ncbi:hypothetical protein ACQEVF_20950 [Nonomuraea polychroma]|uniref:hypothetical protein n=1 Tax=Nonomuraea polychroma TaxID=46176 RepID=UPI003D939883